MKKSPDTRLEVIKETSQLVATAGFLALACTMFVAQSMVKIIFK